MHDTAMQMKHATTVLILLGIFLGVFTFSLFLQAGPMTPDPDGFYHIKTAQLISEQGVTTTFPWLTFTHLRDAYTDQHFLYHVFLIPFITNLEPFFGAKLATAFILALLFTLIAAFLIRFRIRFWFVYVGILLVTNPLLFRLNLIKAPGFSLLFLIAGIWLLFRKKPWPLALLAFVYVWTYGGFPLLGIAALLYAGISALHGWHRRRTLLSIFRRILPRSWQLRTLVRHPSFTMLAAVATGLVAGVLINPYFPNNLFHYWQQLVQIGIVNFQDVINVGGEWRPYGFIELIAATVFVSIVVLLGIVLAAIRRKRMSPEAWTLLLLAVFFFLITLKSRRYVELYVPFATLFAAFAINDGLMGMSTRALWRRFTGFFERHVALTALLVVYILATALTVIARDLHQLNGDLKRGFNRSYLAGASTWLADHTPAGSIVVHSDWDEFPILFYHNSHNHYIVGLDPTFMYVYDRTLYERWADLTSGKRSKDATQIITQDLSSSYVLVTKDHAAFNRTMQAQDAFEVVYEDDDAKIYQVRQGK